MENRQSSSTSDYSDYSIYAETDSRGVLKLLVGKEAVENALRLWLVSFPGEVIRSPQKGGYITRWLFKPMNEDTQQMIREAIMEGLYEDFSPALKLKSLEVTPIYDKEQWRISITAYSPFMKTEINVIENMRTMK